MLLEDYLDFLSSEDIRIKGHRIGIENVIKYYLSGYTPEEILAELPSLNLEKIYAVITHYLGNQIQVDDYMFRLEQLQEQHYQEWLIKEPSDVVNRMRSLKAQAKRELILLS